MPVDFAEHYVPCKHHQLSRGAALGADRERVAGFVETEAANESGFVQVLAVRHAGVKAVAVKVVQLVDVDRPGEDRREELFCFRFGFPGDDSNDQIRISIPVVFD